MENEWKNLRFHLTEEMNNMMIELLVTEQIMKENLNELKYLNFYFTDDMKQTLFDMLAIQKMLESDELSYK